MRRPATALATLVLASSLALAGCATREEPADDGGAQAPTTPTGPEVAPAAGPKVEGDAYTFTVPEGWGFPPEAPAGYDASMFAADLDDIEDGFSDNVNVITSPAGEITPEQVETDGVAELEAANATDVTVQDRVTAAGTESAHLSAGFSAEGVDYLIDQYYLTDAGQTHIVTFSFSPDVAQEDRDALAASVLATWTWN